jgi:hypothetical protein
VAQPFFPSPDWPNLGKVIECFVLSGCHLFDGPEIIGDHDTYRIRYLYNPETDQYANLGRLDNDDWVLPEEVRGWERDLGIEIPKPWGSGR